MEILLIIILSIILFNCFFVIYNLKKEVKEVKKICKKSISYYEDIINVIVKCYVNQCIKFEEKTEYIEEGFLNNSKECVNYTQYGIQENEELKVLKIGEKVLTKEQINKLNKNKGE